MKKWLILVFCAVGLAGLITGAYFLYDKFGSDYAPETIATEAPADKNKTERPLAPDFTVTDKNGNEVSLSDFAGKPVVLNLWASWCSPCKSEMPAFDAAYAEYGNDIVFMMVNLTDGQGETLTTAKRFLETVDYEFPVYFDTDLEVAMNYSIGSIPVTYFIDSNGYLVAYANGAMTENMLAQGLGMITK